MEDKNSILSYYQNNYFHDYAADQSKRDEINFNNQILDIIERYHKKGRLLDAGCGCGFFLHQAKKRGWNVYGVDPSEESITVARGMLGNDVFVGTIQELEKSASFEVVTMINVIDHISRPCKDIRHSIHLLQPGGLLYLRFPNGQFHRSIIKMRVKITQKPILNRFLVFHEYSFTPFFIRNFLAGHGLHHIRIRNARLSGTALYNHSPLSLYLGGGLNAMLWWVLSFLQNISCRRWHLGPSLEVTAIKK